MPVQVGIVGNYVNGVHYSFPFLQGAIGLPLAFDGVPMKNDLMHLGIP
jgi:hypothetical protein